MEILAVEGAAQRALRLVVLMHLGRITPRAFNELYQKVPCDARREVAARLQGGYAIVASLEPIAGVRQAGVPLRGVEPWRYVDARVLPRLRFMRGPCNGSTGIARSKTGSRP